MVPLKIPNEAPATVSIKKCCKRYTLDSPVNTARNAKANCCFLVNGKSKISNVDIVKAVVVCPEGKLFKACTFQSTCAANF